MSMISAGQLVRREIGSDVEQRSHATARHPVTIAVGADVLRVFFEEAVWAQMFAERYADQLAVSREPTVRHYVLRDPAGYVFWSPGETASFWTGEELDAGSVVFLADATAISALMHASATLVSFHAAAVVLDDVAGAIAGDSSAGKTTTALACGRTGLQLYSDERCVVAGGVVVPFARTLNVRSDGWRRLQSASASAATELPAGAQATASGFSIGIDDLFGRFDRTGAPRFRAVFLISGTGTQARLETVPWRDVAPALAKSMSCRERGLQRGARLIETLRDVSCYRLHLGSPQESAALVSATLAALRPAP